MRILTTPPRIALDRMNSEDSWCTSATRLSPSQLSSTVHSLSSHLLAPGTLLPGQFSSQELSSQDLSEAYFDAEDTFLDLRSDPSIPSCSSSTVISPESSPTRPMRPRRLEPSRPRRISSLRNQDAQPSVSETRGTEIRAPFPALGEAEWGETPARRDSGHADLAGLWGCGWNDLGAWSPHNLDDEAICERISAESETDQRTHCDSSIRSRFSFEALRESIASQHQHQMELAQRGTAGKRLRSLLRHTKSTMSVGRSSPSQQKRVSSAARATSPPFGPEVVPSHPSTLKRTGLHAAGKKLSKWLRLNRGDRPERAQTIAFENTESPSQARSDICTFGATYPPAKHFRDAMVEYDSPLGGSVASRPSVDWSRRPSLASIYPRSILASPVIGPANSAASNPHLAPPLPPSPTTSRHVSFEDHRHNRPSLSFAEPAGRRSCSNNRGRCSTSSARSRELHRTSSAELFPASLRVRSRSERSSGSCESPRSFSSSSPSAATNFSGLRTPSRTSINGLILSPSQIFEQGPKPISRNLNMLGLDAASSKTDLALNTISGTVKEAVERATRPWSSLSFYAEDLECEDAQGEPVVTVRRRKSNVWRNVNERSRSRAQTLGETMPFSGGWEHVSTPCLLTAEQAPRQHTGSGFRPPPRQPRLSLSSNQTYQASKTHLGEVWY